MANPTVPPLREKIAERLWKAFDQDCQDMTWAEMGASIRKAYYKAADAVLKIIASQPKPREWNFTCEGCGKHSDEGKNWRHDPEDSIWLCPRCCP
jgi:hypothetical protein